MLAAALTASPKTSNNPRPRTAINEDKKMNNDTATTATSLRMPDGLLRQLTKAAHKCEMSRTEYINQALQEAVNKTLEIKQ